MRLIRGGKTYEIRAETLLADGTHNIAMRGGDKVIIEEDARYFVVAGATGDRIIDFETRARHRDGGPVDGRRADRKPRQPGRHPGSARLSGRRRCAPMVWAAPKCRQVVFTVDLTSADGLFAAREFEINPGDLVMVTESADGERRQVVALVSDGVC